nr:MAG TPA: hypothetical protein [Caudoviricetes sp.]
MNATLEAYEPPFSYPAPAKDTLGKTPKNDKKGAFFEKRTDKLQICNA